MIVEIIMDTTLIHLIFMQIMYECLRQNINFNSAEPTAGTSSPCLWKVRQMGELVPFSFHLVFNQLCSDTFSYNKFRVWTLSFCHLCLTTEQSRGEGFASEDHVLPLNDKQESWC